MSASSTLIARIEALIHALDAETAAVTDGRLDGLAESSRRKQELATALDAAAHAVSQTETPDPDLMARLQAQLERAIARNSAALDAARTGLARARAQVDAALNSVASLGAYGPDGSSVSQVSSNRATRRA
ncbi:hypothetical protein [Futiania mangrovi]|uniref:Flagellar protein FlgN n=1 Tax=Futiania mangrovi TaxID=2959716 RepID=A0A9J6PJV7_9PROT|nr:hypothetical protein [Futiania mangrovii]MCP1336823.1 hypothetical protein [Futiania mangrovii]